MAIHTLVTGSTKSRCGKRISLQRKGALRRWTDSPEDVTCENCRSRNDHDAHVSSGMPDHDGCPWCPGPEESIDDNGN